LSVAVSVAFGTVLAAGFAGGSLTTGTAAALPNIPNIPNLPTDVPGPPHVQLPKPDQSAVFNLVVEGTATDELVSRLEGNSGVCLVNEDGDVNETATYRRGKGSPVQFDRYGNKVIMHRVGREFDSSFAAQVTTVRTASGGSHFIPTLPIVECPKPYELSSNTDCKKKFQSSANMLLSYTGRRLGLALSEKSAKAKQAKNECGSDPQTGISSAFELAWPVSPKLEPSAAGALNPKAIFGHQKSFSILLRSSDRGIKQKRERMPGYGQLHGSEKESAFNEATVRLIRMPGG
jgi:hypothetical protein